MRLFAVLSALVLLLFLLALLIGPAGIGPAQSLHALVFGGDGPLIMVMREIRLPNCRRSFHRR